MYQKVLIWLLKIYYQDNNKGSKFLPSDSTKPASNVYKRSSSLCNLILSKKPFLARTNSVTSATTLANTCEYGSEGYQVPHNAKHFLPSRGIRALIVLAILHHAKKILFNNPIFPSSWPFGKIEAFLFWICTLTKENLPRNVETLILVWNTTSPLKPLSSRSFR